MKLPEIIEDASNSLDDRMRELLRTMSEHLTRLDDEVELLEARITESNRQDLRTARLQAIPGIGPITASALVAALGDAVGFDSGRNLSAFLGLVPRQHSTGGKPTLLGITKRGDCYLRTLLIHGARAVLRAADKRQDALGTWMRKLLSRRGRNVVAVALANRNARIVWALLKHKRHFDMDFSSAALA